MNTSVSSPTQMSAAVHSTGTTQVSNHALEKAVAEFSKKAGVTSPEITEFRNKLETRITQRVDSSNSKMGRKLRKAALLAISEELPGINWVVDRNVKPVDFAAGLHTYVTTGKKPELTIDSKGGITYAYLLESVQTEQMTTPEINVMISTAICRDDENFDPLFGKELTVDRMLEGDVIVVPFHGSVFERHGFNAKTLSSVVDKHADVLKFNKPTVQESQDSTLHITT